MTALVPLITSSLFLFLSQKLVSFGLIFTLSFYVKVTLCKVFDDAVFFFFYGAVIDRYRVQGMSLTRR